MYKLKLKGEQTNKLFYTSVFPARAGHLLVPDEVISFYATFIFSKWGTGGNSKQMFAGTHPISLGCTGVEPAFSIVKIEVTASYATI